ncbi:hypothetical protein [Pseudomonas yamanorum]|uniref:hypothetical protein n=1 Tax=Pseudomonas yamanorum TaxID=515393 RepID=UPI003F74E9D4
MALALAADALVPSARALVVLAVAAEPMATDCAPLAVVAVVDDPFAVDVWDDPIAIASVPAVALRVATLPNRIE